MPDLKRAASIGALGAGVALLSYYAYQSFFGKEETVEPFSPEEELKWRYKFQDQEVTNHRKFGPSCGGLQRVPLMNRARSLPGKELIRAEAPPKMNRAISAPQTSFEEIGEPPMKEETEEEAAPKAKDIVENMTNEEQDDLLDDLLADEDAVPGEDDTKYDEEMIANEDAIYSYNWLVEIFPKNALECIFGFIGTDIVYCNLGREGFHINKDIFLDNPKIIVQGVSTTRFQPTLVFTIGAPGSGKTTWARNVYGEEAVIAADDWFDKFNNGEFDRNSLGTAHAWCKSQILARLERNENAVCNKTNTTLNEMYDLTSAVYFGQLPHKIVFAIMPEMNVKVLFKRNEHSVPKKSINNMIKNIKRAKDKHNIFKILQAGPMRLWKRHKTAKFEGKDILYTGLFLDKPSLATLRDVFCDYLQQPLLPKLMNGHVTLAFQPPQVVLDNLPRGKRIQIRILGVASSPVVQCARVQILDEDVADMCTNEFPHVTLAVEQRYSPVMSNQLLKYGGWIELDEDVILDCTVGFFQGRKINISPKSFMRQVSNYWLGDEDMEEELR